MVPSCRICGYNPTFGSVILLFFPQEHDTDLLSDEL